MLYEQFSKDITDENNDSLNPYSNGICSMSHYILNNMKKITNCLNPYSNGICSMRGND